MFVGRGAGEVERTIPFVVVERNVDADRGGGDRRERRDFGEELVEERVELFFLVVARFGQRDRHRQDIARVEPERRLLRLPETFQHESAAGEKHDRERDLGDDEPRARALFGEAIAAPARTFVQGKRERAALRNSPGGPDANEDSGNDCDRDGE